MACLAAAVFMVGASGVSADQELQLDLNSLKATFTPSGGDSLPFTTSSTGTIALVDDSNTSLADILKDGASQTLTGTLKDFTGSITLSGGSVTGGSFSVEAYDVGSAGSSKTYTASIKSSSGSVNTQAGQGFTIDGLTFSGLFSGTSFAGVDVTPWDSNEPLDGSFLEFAFNPSSTTGVDNDADVDLYVLVPLPVPALLAASLFGVVGGAGWWRRRRAAA